ncbi:MAG: 1,4-alpha-glucan branching protein GlgB [Clostridia bacterium]|nr:1,4-alpha-glucan branching protein GlgB [Clostridia bacterium]
MSREDLPSYLVNQGTNYRTPEFLGSHVIAGKVHFRVWAPNAEQVYVTGDFCGWDYTAQPMERATEGGIWKCVIPLVAFERGMLYKYYIIGKNGAHLKADPYAFSSETLNHTASRIYPADGFRWSDSAWMKQRRELMADRKYDCPINIYEMHLGSWKTRGGMGTADGEHYLNYREIADELVPYVKEMGYTHVELLPIMEHPYDGSWGYQVCGYFAPTARFGDPKDFKYFINKLHRNGIGVILDWVPAHFPKDEHGLYEFDGQPLYEYQGQDRMEHRGWGTRFFDVGRNEVQCFLISNALFWLNHYHADGLRVDAVASMLYLDYDRMPGEWIPNREGGNQNVEAIAFFKKLNSIIAAEVPDAMMIAEESTSWPQITKPVEQGGLGFSFKWNMGCANDLYDYVACDPLFRRHKHDKLTFSMMYSFNENYILPISHDEVVHGKKSLLDKMFGGYYDKFACHRAFMCHMMAHPGKKLLFMGSEYGQFREWDYENQLEWFMLDYEMHEKLRHFTAELNRLYLECPPLWSIDDSWAGFDWINPDDADSNVISYRRISADGSSVICVMNFSGIERRAYPVKVGRDGIYEVIFNSDDIAYGGAGMFSDRMISAIPEHDCGALLHVDLAPLSAVYLTYGTEKEPAPTL